MSEVDGFHELFELMVEKGASDLHLRVPSLAALFALLILAIDLTLN